MTESRQCPNCSTTMEYRLGEYQCPSCEHTEKAEILSGPATSGPGLRQPAATLQNYDPQAGRQDFIKDYRLDTGPSPDYDPSPGLSNEKLILLGLFLVQALVNIFSVANQGGQTAGGTSLSTVLLMQGGTLLMLAVVFFVPFIPLKWLMATLSCLVGMLGALGLIMGLLALTFFGSLLGLLAWLAQLLNVGVNLWIASVLYRDIQKMQLG